MCRVSRVVSLRVQSSIRRRHAEVIQYNVTYRYKLFSNVVLRIYYINKLQVSKSKDWSNKFICKAINNTGLLSILDN